MLKKKEITKDFIDSLKVDKVNGQLAYNDSEHIYWNTKHRDRVYTSVTTLVGKYYEPFDEYFWSRYKALEKLVGISDFSSSGIKSLLLTKKKWDDKHLEMFDISLNVFEAEVAILVSGYAKNTEEACDRGTVYHNARENTFYTSPIHKITDYNFGLDLPQLFSCEKNNFDLNRENAVLPEYLVYYSSPSGILNVAGQIDVVLKQGDDIYVIDYKTNRKGIETKAYFNPRTKKKKMMYAPLNNVEDSTLEHYTMQLSIYAYMLQQINPNFNIKLLRIVHVDGDGVETLIDLTYRKKEVQDLFKHYEKQIVIDFYRKHGRMITSHKDYFAK